MACIRGNPGSGNGPRGPGPDGVPAMQCLGRRDSADRTFAVQSKVSSIAITSAASSP